MTYEDWRVTRARELAAVAAKEKLMPRYTGGIKAGRFYLLHNGDQVGPMRWGRGGLWRGINSRYGSDYIFYESGKLIDDYRPELEIASECPMPLIEEVKVDAKNLFERILSRFNSKRRP